MLNDGSLDLVASVEGFGLDGEEAMGFGDLRASGLAEIREDWKDRRNKWNSW